MIVNELAKRADAEPHVVRYYTRIGLLKPERNPENGYKLFAEKDLKKLKFIRQAKCLGYSLNEITEILSEAENGHSPCQRVREIISQRIVENRKKLNELVQLQHRMETALEQWEDMPDGTPDGDSVCILIESIAADASDYTYTVQDFPGSKSNGTYKSSRAPSDEKNSKHCHHGHRH